MITIFAVAAAGSVCGYFFGSLIIHELKYRDKIKARTLFMGGKLVHWEGVPGFNTILVIKDPNAKTTEIIDFIGHHHASCLNEHQLRQVYNIHLNRHIKQSVLGA